MSEQYLLGIDAGTSQLKAVVFDLAGKVKHQAAIAVKVDSSQPGWMQQDMQMVWEQTASVIRRITDTIPARQIVAVGITGQGDGAWMLDQQNRPLMPAPLWNDARAVSIITDWETRGILRQVYDHLGTMLWPGAQAPILAWLKNQHPDLYKKLGTVFCCKDWLKYKLTGVLCTDETDGSIPFMDLAQRQFSDHHLHLMDLADAAHALPDVLPSHQIIGSVTDEAATLTGLLAGTPVANGMLDVVANAIGVGITATQQSFSILGTTGINGILMDTANFAPQYIGATVCYCLADRWLRVMGTMSGTPSLEWCLSVMGQQFQQDEVTDYAALENAASAIQPGADGVIFHPYLKGERAPFLNPQASGAFFGLRDATTTAHFLRAVYEGVACSIRHCYETIGQRVDTVLLSGGGSKSALWCQILADQLNSTIQVPAGDEFGTLGAAIAAGIGIGVFEDYTSACQTCVEIARTYHPQATNTSIYDRQYEQYSALVEALTPFWGMQGTSP